MSLVSFSAVSASILVFQCVDRITKGCLRRCMHHFVSARWNRVSNARSTSHMASLHPTSMKVPLWIVNSHNSLYAICSVLSNRDSMSYTARRHGGRFILGRRTLKSVMTMMAGRMALCSKTLLPGDASTWSLEITEEWTVFFFSVE